MKGRPKNRWKDEIMIRRS